MKKQSTTRVNLTPRQLENLLRAHDREAWEKRKVDSCEVSHIGSDGRVKISGGQHYDGTVFLDVAAKFEETEEVENQDAAFKLVKVFDSAKMPADVADYFAETFRDEGDTIAVFVERSYERLHDETAARAYKWFIDNGCDNGEQVVVERGNWIDNYNDCHGVLGGL